MKRKSLLVGAISPFLGPWVHLEIGEWVIDLPALNGAEEVSFEIDTEQETFIFENRELHVFGPSRLRVNLINGSKVFMSAQQIARA